MTRTETLFGRNAGAARFTNYSAYAYSIAVDNQGNVFTTGFESDGLTDGEFIT